MNEACAADLHNRSSFLPVGHCAYYACFQRICHICYYVIGKTKDQIARECSQSIQGSHNYQLNIALGLIAKEHPDESRDLRNNIMQLKVLRESADYGDENFDSSKSQSSLNLMREILPVLKKY